jgi:hypothetical protein
MINMEENKRKLKIISLIPKNKRKIWKNVEKYWKRFLNYEHIIKEPLNIKIFTKEAVDILYLWKDSQENFDFHFYSLFKKQSKTFKYVIISDKPHSDDYKIFKKLVDDVVYLNDFKLLQWKTFAIARRHWKQHSNLTTIIYHDIIADFLENVVIINNKRIELTKIESKLLRYLMQRKHLYTSKNKLFKYVWGYEEDTSRNLEQIVFKLKNKIGRKYFHFSRKEGYKFE